MLHTLTSLASKQLRPPLDSDQASKGKIGVCQYGGQRPHETRQIRLANSVKYTAKTADQGTAALGRDLLSTNIHPCALDDQRLRTKCCHLDGYASCIGHEPCIRKVDVAPHPKVEGSQLQLVYVKPLLRGRWYCHLELSAFLLNSFQGEPHGTCDLLQEAQYCLDNRNCDGHLGWTQRHPAGRHFQPMRLTIPFASQVQEERRAAEPVAKPPPSLQ
mmetsp:Transcript_16374/g.38478  ORF Transcript_16374/g.38478 Transcript_16374/m.38478 type:complete len:216 (-) Transcript_16374:129-776(-)